MISIILICNVTTISTLSQVEIVKRLKFNMFVMALVKYLRHTNILVISLFNGWSF